MRLFTFAAALLLSSTLAQADELHEWCGTPSPSAELAGPFIERLQKSEPRLLPKASVSIPIAFHAIHDGKNGVFTKEQMAAVVNNMNWAFRDTPYTFRLQRFESIKNRELYFHCVVDQSKYKRIRNRYAFDPKNTINVYTCKLGADILGISTFPPGYPVPGNPFQHSLQGIFMDHTAIGTEKYPNGMILAHEIGHYLGLFHTFESYFNPGREKCADPGDYVDDTPTQGKHYLGSCFLNVFDSCPAMPGKDDVANFMDYATEACLEHFSPRQIERMNQAVEQYRPTLGDR
jgi:pregnancy-associated plasma protein-A